jgi:protein TonB
MQAARISLWIALAALVACSKTEPPPPAQKAAPTAPKAAAPASPAPAAAPPTAGEIDEGLKERLARQEAAAKMFESKVLSPPAPAAPKPPADARPAVPPPAAPPKVEAPRAEVAKAPPKAEPPKAEPPKTEAPKAAPVAAAPAPAPAPAPATRTDVAAAKPTTAVPEAAVTRLVSRVDPEYPREAASSGYESGYVKARMTLDAAGNVTRVEILAANPRRVFDRAVTRALSQWRYNEGAAGRTVDMEIDFKR